MLCTQLIIKSLRRIMEFTEMTLAEYSDMKPEGDGYVICIAKHKTAEKGQNEI